MEDALEITPAIALKFQAELHKYTQHAIDQMWKARNTAKYGKTTPSELCELRTFEAAIKSWKTDLGWVRSWLKVQKPEYEHCRGNRS